MAVRVSKMPETPLSPWGEFLPQPALARYGEVVSYLLTVRGHATPGAGPEFPRQRLVNRKHCGHDHCLRERAVGGGTGAGIGASASTSICVATAPPRSPHRAWLDGTLDPLDATVSNRGPARSLRIDQIRSGGAFGSRFPARQDPRQRAGLGR
jgi:hypothetical protein